jgi:hypothetical protein
MLTFFSIPKAFAGHIGVIQRNAIRSWLALAPGIEVILFGDDTGVAQAASDLGVRHEPNVERNGFGTILVNGVFAQAPRIARHDVMCYSNCDIILTQDFRAALERVREAHREFLMVGQRWDLDITEPLFTEREGWGIELREIAQRQRRQRPANWIDYFAFSRGLYGADMPPFAIGRTSWDNWLIWKALDRKKPVVDVSRVVVAVHQNHDYSHHPQGARGAWHGEEAQANQRLLGDADAFCTIENATHRMRTERLVRNRLRWMVKPKRKARAQLSALWFSMLDLSRPVRSALGLRSATATPQSQEKTYR